MRWRAGPVRAPALKAGDNKISITALSGSWVLNDCVALDAPAGTELAPLTARSTVLRSMGSPPVLVEKNGKVFQPVQVTLRHTGAEGEAVVRVGGAESLRTALRHGPYGRCPCRPSRWRPRSP